jgi:hypothetical protein
MRAYAEGRAKRGGYADGGEFVLALLEADQLEDHTARLASLLVELSDGPFTPWTSSDLDAVRSAPVKM